jgi:hypothetical protein
MHEPQTEGPHRTPAIPRSEAAGAVFGTRTPNVRVVPHPCFPGFWAILVNGSLYGKFERRALAIAYAVTRV